MSIGTIVAYNFVTASTEAEAIETAPAIVTGVNEDGSFNLTVFRSFGEIYPRAVVEGSEPGQYAPLPKKK